MNIALAAKARGLIIDYRLAPEHAFPAALEDALAASGWLLDGHAETKSTTIAGDSSGGGLALALGVSIRDMCLPVPEGIVCLLSWTDLAFTGETWAANAKADAVVYPVKDRESARLYRGNADPRHPMVSPIYADLKGLPPIMIQVGSSEFLLSDSLFFAERTRAAGMEVALEEWDRMQHVLQFITSFAPEGRRAIGNIGDFIQRHT